MDDLGKYIDLHVFMPLAAAIVLGGLVGLEREIHRKPAGLRTNILICLGAALFTLIGFELVEYNADMSKLLAGVITGVGFIGAGVLIQDRSGVHGLTSAATIWLVTAIGIVCGLERYGLAVGVTLTTLLILWALNPLDKRLRQNKKKISRNVGHFSVTQTDEKSSEERS